MQLTQPILALLSVLPLLITATAEPQPQPEPEVIGGLVIKKVDLSRKRQQTTGGGAYVSNYAQCTQVCDGYFGKPSVTGNNAVVQPITTTTSKASSTTSRATTVSTTSKATTVSTTSRATTSSTSTTPKPTTTTTTTTSSVARPSSSSSSSVRPSSAAISSAKPTSSSTAAASPTSGTSVGGATPAQQKLILDLHNAERRDYGASPLTWNPTLEKYALDYAKKCQWKHSGGPYGENLAASYGWPDAISTGINGWNNERSDYNPSNPTYSHWTQVVWKGTSQVGCAIVKCPAGSIQPGWGETDSLVCEYQSPGNYAGQYGTNVGTRVAA